MEHVGGMGEVKYAHNILLGKPEATEYLEVLGVNGRAEFEEIRR
jgi:hypothetical protein